MKEFFFNICYWLFLVVVLIIGVVFMIYCKYICIVNKFIFGIGK